MKIMTLDPRRTHINHPNCLSRIAPLPDGRRWRCVDCGADILWTNLEAEEIETVETFYREREREWELRREEERRRMGVDWSRDQDHAVEAIIEDGEVKSFREIKR